MSDIVESNKPSQSETKTANRYEILDNSEQRAVLKRRGIDMVRDSIDADMVVFLDKSARPLAHLYRKLFPVVFPDRLMPKIKFLNIGTEKMGPLYSVAWDRVNEGQNMRKGLPKVDSVIPTIHTQDDLASLYGKANVDLLEKILEVGDEPQKRLIIEDVENTGRTIKLAETVIAVVDPKSYYAHFTFLDSPEDKLAFKIPDSFGRTNRAALPWHGDTGFVEEIDPEYNDFNIDSSFVTRRADSNTGRNYSLEVRRELEILVDEIKVKAA